MVIDGCRHSFNELTKVVLPEHLQSLERAIEYPVPAKKLVGFKSASRAALKAINEKADFSGCYVFLDGGKPIYVGISRGVIGRLIQHLNGSTHYVASLVYRMACNLNQHEMKREQAMKDEKFKKHFLDRQQKLQEMSFAFVKIKNDLELYLFEAYAAMRYDTSKWNSFRTH